MSASTTNHVAPAADAQNASRFPRLGGWFRKQRLRTWLVRLLFVLIGVALLYIVAGNVFVRTRLLRHLVSEDPNAVLLDYEEAWTFFPGRAHAKMLTLRGRDSNVEWILKIDDVDFTVSLRELLQSRFHATRVRGSGVSFVVRRRIPEADITPLKLAALPRIPGFGEAPIADPVKPPPLSDAEYNLWRIELNDVIADPVREVWVDELRFVGDARITGGFFLQPARAASVGPAHVDFRSGEILTASDGILRDVHGKVDCTIHKFDVQTVGGADVLDYLNTEIALDGSIPSLAFLHDVADVSATGGAGPAHLDVAADEGSLTKLDVDVTSQAAHIAMADHAVRGSARTRMKTTERGIEVDLGATGLELWRADESAALVHAPGARAIVKTQDRKLTRLFNNPWASIDVPEAQIPDVRRFDAYLSKKGDLHFEGGRGTLRARAELGPSSGHGDATLKVADLQGRLKDQYARGDVTLDAKVDKANWARGEVDFAGTRVAIANARVRDAEAKPWSATATLPRAMLKMGQKLDFNGHVDATCLDARPLFDLLIANTPVPKWAVDLLSIHGVGASADLSVAPPNFAVRNMRAKVQDRFDVAADIMNRDGNAHSVVLVDSGPLSFGLESRNGDTSIAPFASKDWFGKIEETFR